jgi:hypothetical protein
MSVHRECGADIRWFRRDDDPERYRPPMELAGEGYVITDEGGLEFKNIYRPHMCDPEAIASWQQYKENLAEAKGEPIDDYEAVTQRRSDEQWDIALPVSCRTCKATPGEYCISQQKHLQKAGEIVNTRWPHPLRVEDGLEFKEALG